MLRKSFLVLPSKSHVTCTESGMSCFRLAGYETGLRVGCEQSIPHLRRTKAGWAREGGKFQCVCVLALSGNQQLFSYRLLPAKSCTEMIPQAQRIAKMVWRAYFGSAGVLRC